MSEFDDLMAEGFGEVLTALSTPTISRKGVTKPCVATPVARSKEMRDSGYWPKFHAIVELARIDYLSLGLVLEQSVVTLRNEDGKHPQLLRVVGIEDDPSDVCVKVTLKEEPLPAEER